MEWGGSFLAARVELVEVTSRFWRRSRFFAGETHRCRHHILPHTTVWAVPTSCIGVVLRMPCSGRPSNPPRMCKVA
eukprot:3029226-Amphidinium_carterae.1